MAPDGSKEAAAQRCVAWGGVGGEVSPRKSQGGRQVRHFNDTLQCNANFLGGMSISPFSKEVHHK